MGQIPSSQIHHHHQDATRITRSHHHQQIQPPSPQSSPSRDFTSDVPDELLALIFSTLSPSDRKRCSSVCRRWLAVEGQSRQRLSLNASVDVSPHLPSLISRFDSVAKLTLRCDRKSISIGDEDLEFISLHCPNLTRLKLRACREISHVGMLAVAKNCKKLSKFTCGSCNFGAKGMNALLNNCASLEELTVKRLRGISEGFTAELIGPGLSANSLKSISLKELYNGQCFEPLISGSKNLNILKVFRCLGDWDRLLENAVSARMNCNKLTEVHFERLQVSDLGLMAVAKCPELEVFHLVKAPDCSDEGIVAIAENCKLLRKLHIDGWRTNRIGDEGLTAVSRNCPNLIELVLVGVNSSSLSMMAIANGCHKLERLALCGSETIGDSEISCVAAKFVALKKLCIKGCRISDAGIKTFAFGCPNLIKIKVKKCKDVSNEVADWLRAKRASLSVDFGSDEAEQEAIDNSASDGGVQDDGNELPAQGNREGQSMILANRLNNVGGERVDLTAPSTSSVTVVRPSSKSSRFSLFAGRNFVSFSCALRRFPSRSFRNGSNHGL